jgi:hypothetical protein
VRRDGCLLMHDQIVEIRVAHDARKFSLNHEIESIAHKDEYKQYNRVQSLVFC